MNGIEVCLLNKLSNKWAGPYNRYFIEQIGYRRSILYLMTGTKAYLINILLSEEDSNPFAQHSIRTVYQFSGPGADFGPLKLDVTA